MRILGLTAFTFQGKLRDLLSISSNHLGIALGDWHPGHIRTFPPQKIRPLDQKAGTKKTGPCGVASQIFPAKPKQLSPPPVEMGVKSLMVKVMSKEELCPVVTGAAQNSQASARRDEEPDLLGGLSVHFDVQKWRIQLTPVVWHAKWYHEIVDIHVTILMLWTTNVGYPIVNVATA